jgi:hypothetical protein
MHDNELQSLNLSLTAAKASRGRFSTWRSYGRPCFEVCSCWSPMIDRRLERLLQLSFPRGLSATWLSQFGSTHFTAGLSSPTF